MKKIEYIIKHNIFVQKLYKFVFSIIFKIIGLFIRPNFKKVMFQSMIGKTYGDSPKVLFEEMLKDEKYKDFEYVWAFDNPDKFDVPNAKKVKLNSLNYFIESLKCGIWITNVDIERGLKYKPKKTIYINTWHGVPLKYIGNSQKNRKDYNYSDVDFICSSCDFLDEIFLRDFKVRKEALVKCGMPRNDRLYGMDNGIKDKVKKTLNIPENKKVILYAPTWRDSIDGGENYVISPPINIEYFREHLSDEYVILFRMHHLTTKQMGIKFDDFVIDCSHYADINELMITADLLVSDYSATIFDYSILEKPILLFAYDYEDYRNARGLYLNLEDLLPNNVVATQEELIKKILDIDYQKEKSKTRKLKNEYLSKEGNATEICMNYLEDTLKKCKK